jgi:hypothetical protein
MIPHRFQLRRLLTRSALAACGAILALSLVGICTNLAFNNQAGTRGVGLSGGVLWVAWRHTTSVDGDAQWTYAPFGFVEVTNSGFRLGFPASKWLSWPAYRKAKTNDVGYVTLPLSLPFLVLICPLAIVHWRKWRTGHDPSELPQAFGHWATHVAGRVDHLYQASSGTRLLVAVRTFSLLVALVLGALWLQSYRGAWHYNGVFHQDTTLVCYVEKGWLYLCRYPEGTPLWGDQAYGLTGLHHVFGFHARRNHYARLPLGIPIWLLLAIAAYPLIPPARRLSRKRRGLCVKCGYDLTGNTSGRCPECAEPTHASQSHAEMIRQENPKWLRIGVSALAFLFALMVACPLVESIMSRLEAMGLLRAIPEKVGIAICLAVVFVLAYVPSRFVYYALRWKLVKADETADEG